MDSLERIAIGSLLALLMAISIKLPVARAGDDWEERWEDRQEELEPRLEDRRGALQVYWQRQREAQRELAFRRPHAWYGDYGPYYAYRVGPSCRTCAPGSYFLPVPSPGCYNFAPESRSNLHGSGILGIGCHDESCDSSLAIGPVCEFWD